MDGRWIDGPLAKPPAQANKRPIGIGHRELTNADFESPSSIPNFFNVQMERPGTFPKPRQRRIQISHCYLKIQPTTKRPSDFGRQPTRHAVARGKHDLRLGQMKKNKALIRPLIGRFKTNQALPEIKADVEVRDNELGHERRPPKT